MVAPCLFHRGLVVHDADVWGRWSTAGPATWWWWWGPKGQEEEEEGGERLRKRTQEKRQRL